MMQTFRALLKLLASRALTPLVLGFFLLSYVAVAFFSDEALGMLMGLVRNRLFFKVLLALVPLNIAACAVTEVMLFVRRLRLRHGNLCRLPAGFFDEELELTETAGFAGLAERLSAAGYRTSEKGQAFFAWRGATAFPARLFFLAGALALFAGIFLSLTTRLSEREALIEGEPIPRAVGNGRVERISLAESSGLLLNRTLAIDVALENGGAPSVKRFGLYPPGRVNGYFLYPRYLGVAPLINFSAPDLRPGISDYYTLIIYPPGKEDGAVIPGTTYKLVFSLVSPASDADPFMSGRFVLHFRVLKGDLLQLEGELPVGGTFSGEGFTLGIPDVRKFVATDFVRDPGVPLIWGAAILLLSATVLWLPVRLVAPRREMLFIQAGTVIHGYSRAEGRQRLHAGVFHEALDLLVLAGGGSPGQLDS